MNSELQHETGHWRYPGNRNDYLQQAALNTGIAAGFIVALYLLVLVVDRYVLGGEYIGGLQMVLLAVLVVVWGLFLAQMAFVLERFGMEVGDNGLTVHQSGRSDYVSFDEIESVDTINRPMWWAMRPDLKPLGQTSRHMVKIIRKGSSDITFAGGLDGEEKLMEILEKKCLESSSSF